MPLLGESIAAASLVMGATRDEFTGFVSDPPPWELAHMTAIAWVLDQPRSSVLLVRHRSHGWSCPGGHVDPDEDPAAAAARELAEETGICAVGADQPFVLSRSVGCARAPGAVHWAFGYLFVADPLAVLTPEAGQPVAWFPIDEPPSPHPPDVEPLLRHLRTSR